MNMMNCIELIDRDDIEMHIPNDMVLETGFDKGVLIISHSLARTGAPLQLYEVTGVLVKLGYTPFVYAPFEGELLDDYSKMGIIVICGSAPAYDEEWMRKLTGIFDTVIVNKLALAQSVRILAPISKRLYWWIHESSYFFNSNNCSNIPSVPSLKIIASSNRTKQHIKRFFDMESTVINVCTRDMGTVESEQRDHTVFLWAGSIDFNKAPQLLLEAILKLKPEEMAISEFYIIGKKSEGSEYVELIENFTERFPNIHFMDAVSHDELMQIIDIVDVVVVTSIEETTSMIAVESLMKSRTLICSDGCGVADYMEEGIDGLIFSSGDGNSLAGKIRFVLSSRDRAVEIGRTGRRVYEQNYSYEIFEKSIEKLLNDTDIINSNMNQCCGCRACVLSCPVNAISMIQNDKGFLYPEVDTDKCIRCGKCRTICPVNAKEHPDLGGTEPDIYAFKLKDDIKRMQSQSGGAFTAFAEVILREGGIVYGVSLTEGFEAVYTEIDKPEDLHKLKGSKYVQADTLNIYERVKARLREGKKVLFAGTSCHVDGLISYLDSEDMTELYTCDLVCHGVPSPGLFRDHIDYQSARFGEIKDYDFRDKSFNGWHTHVETWKINEDETYVSADYTDLFYTNNALRECCYQCRYASFKKPSDITIGDFWGIESVKPEMDDNKGVSLIISRSEKGRWLLDSVMSAASIAKVSTEECLQPNLIAPTVRPKETDLFWEDYKSKPHKYLLQSYAGIRDNRRFNNEMSGYLDDDAGLSRAIGFIDKHQLIISGICGDIWNVRLFLRKTKDIIKNAPVIINVFDERREILNTEMLSVSEYKMKYNNGKVVVVDETHCEAYISELVNKGISPLDILPISFMLDEEV